MNVIKKLFSRKFILASLAVIFSMAFALSGVGGEIGTVCSMIAAFLSPMIYIIVEGRIDEKALKVISEAAKDISEELLLGDDLEGDLEK